MIATMRRALAAVVAFALAFVSPGTQCYQAFGAEFSTAKVSGRGAPAPGVQTGAIPGLSPAAGLAPGVSAAGAVSRAPAPAASGALAGPQAASLGEWSARPGPNGSPLAQQAARLEGFGRSVSAAIETLAKPDLGLEAVHKAGRVLEGAVERPEMGSVAPAAPQQGSLLRRAVRGVGKALRGTTLAIGLATFLTISCAVEPEKNLAAGQGPFFLAADAASTAPVAQEPLSVSVSIDRQGATVGDRIHFKFTLKNGTNKAMTVSSLRAALEDAWDAIPDQVEFEGDAGKDPIVLQPGETKEVVLTVISWNPGDTPLSLKEPLELQTMKEGVPTPLKVKIPEVTENGRSVLPKDKNPDELDFKDNAGLMRREQTHYEWLALLPLLLVLVVGIERVLAAHRERPNAPISKVPLLVQIEQRIADLEKPEAAAASAAKFYEDVYDILAGSRPERPGLLVDYFGLHTRERDAKTLIADLKASEGALKGLGERLEKAAELARRAEALRFGGPGDSPERRAQDVALLKKIFEQVAPKAAKPAKPSGPAMMGVGLMSLFPAAAELQWGNAWALALLIPVAAYALFRLVFRKKGTAFKVSSTASIPGRKSLRQRARRLPIWLRFAAVVLMVLGLARPLMGENRDEIHIQALRSMLVLDLSGSMGDRLATGAGGGGPTKLEAAQEAFANYINAQRRGTTNLVGMVTFADNAYLDESLNKGYDSFISHLKELHASGSTAIGKGILLATAHFIEKNARDLNNPDDPRVAELQDILEAKGLPAALEYAKDKPDLMQAMLQPDQRKFEILLTDGESNTGIPPLAAAQTAKKLGIRIYTIGIAPKGVARVSGYDEQTLKAVATLTGGRFTRVDDAEEMNKVIMEIDAAEKSDARIDSSITVNEYGQYLAMLALLALILEAGLANTRLRMVNGMLIIALPLGGLPPLVPPLQPAAVARTQDSKPSEKPSSPLPLQGVPAEVAAANLLYNEGRYDEAIKRYAEALERYPDLAELYFNTGNAYYKRANAGDMDRARASFEQYLSRTKDPRLASKAHFNMANAAIGKGDGEQALDELRKALRLDSENQDAKWNFELLLKKAQQQQGQDGKGQGKKKGKKQKGKGDGQGNEQGDQEGNEGQGSDGKQGQQAGAGKDGNKSGPEALGEELGQQQKEAGEAARRGMTRNGHGMWGMAALPFLGKGAALTAASPWLLWGLAIGLPVVLGLLIYGIRKKIKSAQAWSPGTAPKSFRAWWGRRRFAGKAGALLLCLFLLGIGSSDPKYGFRKELVSMGGQDDKLLVDVSYSMRYRVNGTWALLKKGLLRAVSRLKGTDRFGLVVFARKARTAAAIDNDYSNLIFKIKHLDDEAEGLGEGSKLPAAVKFTAESFENDKQIAGRRRVIILISDGDIFEEEIEQAIKAAQDHDVMVYTIGMGSLEGDKMLVPTADGTGTEYLMDSETKAPAVSRLREEPLQRIAERTGGRYFRATEENTIDKVLEEVAKIEKGEHAETIESPRAIYDWFLWPALALLLLETLLPSKSVLKKPAPRKKGGAPMAGFALLGIPALPLHTWPLVLPFALLATAAGGFMIADLWTGGALTRRLRWAWQRRARPLGPRVLAELGSLFDLREADLGSLTGFMAAWGRAPQKAKARMIAEASADRQLWRQKLSAAYLSGNSLETQEALLAEMGAASKRHMESMEPVVLELLSRREDLPWLEHVDAARRLARLAAKWLSASREPSRQALLALSSYPDEAVSGPARRALGLAGPAAKSRRSWRARAALGIAALLMGGMATVSGAAGLGTLDYIRDSSQAADNARRIFFHEDMFIFTDHYTDERIPKEVLPVLKRWHEDPDSAGEELEQAIDLLSRSVDPKADNILESIFKNADAVPLTPDAQRKLLTTLIMRDNDQVWRFMEDHMKRPDIDAKTIARMQEMIKIGTDPKIGTIKTFVNSFHFLKGPPQLQVSAAQAIYGSLSSSRSPDGKIPLFWPLLELAQAKHAGDPRMNVWIESFLLRRASTVKPEGIELVTARRVIERIVDSDALANAARIQVFAAPPKPGTPPPASFAETAFGMMESFEQVGPNQTPQGDVPEALAELVKAAINHETLRLIGEAQAIFRNDDFNAKLREEGIVRAPASPLPTYRLVYKLRHLGTLRRLIKEIPLDKPGPQELEFLDRADKVLVKLLNLGQRSGMLASGESAGEKTAEELMPALNNFIVGFGPSQGKVLAEMRSNGLMPENGAIMGEALWRESYGVEDLKKLQRFFRDMAAKNKGWDWAGRPQGLTLPQKRQLGVLLDKIAELIQRATPQPPGHSSLPAAPKDEAAFWRKLAAPGEEGLALARLSEVAEQRKDDFDFQVRALTFLGDHLDGPIGRAANPEEVSLTLRPILDSADKTNNFTAAALALDYLLAGRPRHDVFALGARVEIRRLAIDLIEGAKRAFPNFNARLVSAKVKEKTDSPDPGEYKLGQLEAVRRILKVEAAASDLSDAQTEYLQRADLVLPRLIELGGRAGIGSGGAPEDLVAEPLNEIIRGGYAIFVGSSFLDAMREAGLEPQGFSTTKEFYYQEYTREETLKVRDFLAAWLAKGKALGDDWEPRPLTAVERDYFEKSIKAVDQMLAAFGGAPESKPAGAKPSAPLHGFAPLGLAALPALSPWVLPAVAAVLTLVLAYLLARRWFGAKAEDAARRDRQAEIEKRFRKIDLAAQRLATSVAAGEFRSRFIGAGGTNFAELRPYQAGEDVRDIDWKASARQDGQPLVKKFELEKELPFLVVVDLSASSDFGTVGTSKRTVAEDAAALLALAAAYRGLRVGAVIVTDKIEEFIPPQSGLDNARRLVSRVMSFAPKGRGTNLGAGLDRAARELRSRGLVAVVSDFMSGSDSDGSPEFARSLVSLSKRHDVRPIRVSDPAEQVAFPRGDMIEIEDAETGRTRVIDTTRRFTELQSAEINYREDELRAVFSLARMREIKLSTAEDHFQTLFQSFSAKKKAP